MSDKEWNAFQSAKPEEVKHSQQLPDICSQEVTLFENTIKCRKTHMRGELEHEAFINDDRGRAVRITWKSY